MPSDLVQKMLRGNRHALARLFSMVDDDAGRIPAVMKEIHSRTGAAYCIGITGPPGAGKSTLVEALVQLLRDERLTVGVVAVDPTSPFKGGAVLGDRVRMKDHYLDDGVFIRSLATRGTQGGVSRTTSAAVALLDAFGKDIVLVESAGVGQTALDITRVADTVVVVLVPEAGDSIQFLKAGLTEIADIFVVNKADRDGAGAVMTALNVEIHSRETRDGWTPPVVETQADKAKGVDKLRAAIADHRTWLESDSRLGALRAERRTQEFRDTLRDAIEARLEQLSSDEKAIGKLVARIEENEIDPYSAAAEALDSLPLGRA